MTLRPLPKQTVHRLRAALKKEQQRTRRRYPKRALRFFGKLKNADKRKWQEWGHRPDVITSAGRKDKGPGYAVRVLKLKGGEEVVVKFPTLAAKHFKVTPKEEIRFVRRLVEMVNASTPNAGFTILKPFGHPVGPFIAMERSDLPTIDDYYHANLTPKARKMLSKLSTELGVPQQELKERLIKIGNTIAVKSFHILFEKKLALSKNYPADDWIRNKRGVGFHLKPLGSDHLQIVGQKDGAIQLVPYIDAI